METTETLRIPVVQEVAQKRVYIVGRRNLNSELISYFLNRECRIESTFTQQLDTLHAVCSGERNGNKNLLLIDCAEAEMENLVSLLEGECRDIAACFHVALFNLEQRTGVESEAIHAGVRGFFYRGDSKELFLKGVFTLSQGQLWVSRDVLEKCVVEGFNGCGRSQPGTQITHEHALTKREMEILSLVTIGTKNDDIADKLCISTHTVKTHLYNVFKKINVEDRLQAALWAAKYLQ